MGVYLSRLADHGVLAFHISNRHLDLEPVVARLAEEFHLVSFIRRDRVLEREDSGKRSSDWMALVRDAADLGSLPTDRRWHSAQRMSSTRLWTDDYSNVLALLIRGR
jgi:hypothetical protein